MQCCSGGIRIQMEVLPIARRNCEQGERESNKTRCITFFIHTPTYSSRIARTDLEPGEQATPN